MTSLVPLFQTIDRMSLAEKELIAWYASKELTKERRDQLQVESFVAEEMNRFPAPPELLAENKMRGSKPKDPNSLRGIIEFFMNEKNTATKLEIRQFVQSKKPNVTDQYIVSQLAIMCKKNLFSREGWGDQTIFTLKEAA